jgi:hypothetical protein
MHDTTTPANPAAISHPHFDHVLPSPHPNAYRSKATGQVVLLEGRGASHGGLASEADTYVAIPAMHDGSRLPVHAEPLAWADDPFDVLDKVHALR